jgi:RNA polymerase sigma-70 factor (ECF subfamily)
VNYEEQAAVEQLQRGDIRGLETLVRLHQVKAIRTAYAITCERQAAEDVVSDAFLAVYDHIGQYDRRRPFAPWFYRIVVNGALKAVRSARRRAPSDDPELLDSRAAEEPGPEEEAIRRELRLLVAGVVEALPPKLRAVLVLRYYLEMGEAEMAQTLACPLGTVKWRLHAARAQLRRNLAPSPGVAPDVR